MFYNVWGFPETGEPHNKVLIFFASLYCGDPSLWKTSVWCPNTYGGLKVWGFQGPGVSREGLQVFDQILQHAVRLQVDMGSGAELGFPKNVASFLGELCHQYGVVFRYFSNSGPKAVKDRSMHSWEYEADVGVSHN